MYDQATKRCKCKSGYQSVDGQCVALPGVIKTNVVKPIANNSTIPIPV